MLGELEYIKIIHNKSELKGTAYIEFSLGKYQNEHWKEDSIFIYDDMLAMRLAFVKYVKDFEDKGDIWGIHEIPKSQWLDVIKEIERFNALLESSIDYADFTSKTKDYDAYNLKEDYSIASVKHVEMSNDLIKWLNQNLLKHDYITFIGV